MNAVIVTGGAGLIGRAIVARLLDQGRAVAALDRDAVSCEQLEAGLSGGNGDWQVLRCDVSDETDVAAAVELVATRFGGIDGLVNNAGVSDPVSGPVESLSLADWRRWQDSHLTGAFLMTRACAPALRDAGGAIVNMVSSRALQSEPHCEAYAAAKGGLAAFTHALALSLGPRVRVNAISPGWIHDGETVLTDIDHRQHPVGRVGRPEDVAALAAWLLGEEAGFVTGQQWVLDGGMTRKMIYAD